MTKGRERLGETPLRRRRQLHNVLTGHRIATLPGCANPRTVRGAGRRQLVLDKDPWGGMDSNHRPADYEFDFAGSRAS